jgi:Peptidase S46
LNRTAQRDLVAQQLAGFSDVLQVLSFVNRIADEKEKPQADRNSGLVMASLRARGALPEIFADRNATFEREIFAFLLRKAAELPAGQKIEAVEKRFGSLQGEARVRAEEAFARTLTEGKNFSTAEAVNALFDKTKAQLKELNEPLIDFAFEISNLAGEIGSNQRAFNATVLRWRPLLVQGMSEMRGSKPYPDANRTLRFTYGDVRGYVPHDAAAYQPFTNLSGVIEKDTGREPFDAPEKLKQLYRARDFGAYATADGQNVPVDFLSTTDIIGGNSGSPIMNGRGEQVGIIFDGNYEGLGNEFFYNDAKGRAISVDIRYVLFIADKFGGAGYLLKELDIRNAPAALRRAA